MQVRTRKPTVNFAPTNGFQKKPTTIGFSCGDPNGIGAEILVKVFQDNRMFREATPVFYGTPNLIEAAIEKAGEPEVNWAVVEGADKAKATKSMW